MGKARETSEDMPEDYHKWILGHCADGFLKLFPHFASVSMLVPQYFTLPHGYPLDYTGLHWSQWNHLPESLFFIIIFQWNPLEFHWKSSGFQWTLLE